MSDGRIATLNKAELADIDAAQKRYQHISDTLDDAVGKLQKIVDAGSDGLRGQYVEPLKKDAASIKDSLSKAAVRYHDAAAEIQRYEPELSHAKDEVNAARAAAADADSSMISAKSMPDPQKGSDGTISPDEQQKATAKQQAEDSARDAFAAAKKRLTDALDALDVAGKRLGDAVNCKNYDDGLTDSVKDKILVAFKMISKIFGVIALVLSVLAFLIPGLQVLAVAAVVAGAVLLISDSVLLANGEGDVSSVILDAVGLGLGGLGAGFTKFAKGLGSLGKIFGGAKPAGTGVVDLAEGGGMIITPKPGFWAGEGDAFKATWDAWKNFFTGPMKGDFGALGKSYLLNIIDGGTLEGVISAGFDFKKWWWAWGLGNLGFNLGASVGYAGYQVNQSFASGS